MKINVIYDLNEIDSNLAQFTIDPINLYLNITFAPNLYYIIALITLENCEPLVLCKNTQSKVYKLFKQSTVNTFFQNKCL